MMKRRFRRFFGRHRRSSIRLVEAPLSFLCAGEAGVIIRVSGGHGMLERMAALGFIPGTEVVVLQNFGYGPIIVRVHEAHIALGRGVAARIQIHRDKA
jgi:ferrous iron transport protein A